MLFRISTVVVALALPRIASTAGQCFLPDGSKDDNDVPCLSNDSTSRCCSPDEFCSTNKLCVSKKDASKLTRGSCLDMSFGSTCPTFCKGVNDSKKVEVFKCDDPSLGQFCCDNGKGDYACCQSPSNILTLGVGTTFLEASAASTIMSSMSNPPTTSTSETPTSSTQESTTSSAKAERKSTKTQTETSIQTTTSTQVQTTVQTQTSVEAQTSIQTQTSAQVITSIQTQTSAQVVTSVQVQTSVQTSIMVITSVAVQTSISVQSQVPPISIPSSAISQLPATISSSSFQEPSTSFLQTSSSMVLPLSTSPLISSLMQPSTSILSTSATPAFSPTAASIKQSLTSSPPQSVPASTTTPVPKIPDQTTDGVPASLTSAIIAGAISAANNPVASPGVSTASIISGSVGGAIILTGLIIAGVIFFKRRAQNRASAQLEAALGRTNFADEKGSIRSGRGWNGDNGFASFKFGNSGSDRGISPPLVNRNGGPVDTRAGTTQVMDQGMAPVQMYGARNTYQRTSGGRFSIFSRSTAAPYRTESYMSEQGIPRRFTGDGGSSFGSSAALVNAPLNRAIIPERGLEKRVSGGTLESIQRAENAQRPGYPDVGTTFRSETFDKLLYDVQSQPF